MRYYPLSFASSSARSVEKVADLVPPMRRPGFAKARARMRALHATRWSSKLMCGGRSSEPSPALRAPSPILRTGEGESLQRPRLLSALRLRLHFAGRRAAFRSSGDRHGGRSFLMLLRSAALIIAMDRLALEDKLHLFARQRLIFEQSLGQC